MAETEPDACEDPAISPQILILVRHGKSVANEWKEHGGGFIDPDTVAANPHLSNAALSLSGRQDVHRFRDDLWRHVRHVADGRVVRVFCSPLKRALETCVESLECESAAWLFQSGPGMHITPIAMAMEKGYSEENVGVPLEKIQVDPYLDRKLHGRPLGDLLDWSHFYDGGAPNPDWSELQYRNDAARRCRDFEHMLKWRRKDWSHRPPQGECIVLFCHWGFVRAVTGKSDMMNFGEPSDGDAGKLHQKAIVERLLPDADFAWWRQSGEYERHLWSPIRSQLAQWNGRCLIGTNHWGASDCSGIETGTNGGLLTDGVNWVAAQLGQADPTLCIPLKVYLGACAPEKYPGFAFDAHNQTPQDMVTIAQHSAYADILDSPLFPVVALVAYRPTKHGEAPFLAGRWGQEDGDTAWTEFLKGESDAFQAFTEHLMNTYSGKTFVLQNWEGDNALTDCGKREVSDGDKTRMAEWLSARQRGVECGRDASLGKNTASGFDCALVLHATEVNLVLEEGRCHATWILREHPALSHPPDLVSYSFYEWDKQDCAQGVARLRTGLESLRRHTRRSAFATRHLTAQSQVYVGEFGSGKKTNKDRQQRHVDVIFLPRVAELLWEMHCPLGLFWNLQNNEKDQAFELRSGTGTTTRPLPTWFALLSLLHRGGDARRNRDNIGKSTPPPPTTGGNTAAE